MKITELTTEKMMKNLLVYRLKIKLENQITFLLWNGKFGKSSSNDSKHMYLIKLKLLIVNLIISYRNYFGLSFLCSH